VIPPDRLRLVVITDARLAGRRGIEAVVEAALGAGAPAIQLREKQAGAGEMLSLARRLRELTRAANALLFVNDRVDVALAAQADGVHLGPRDLPVELVRRYSPAGFLIGYSTDDPELARRAVDDGADYIGCGTVWATSTKEDAGRAIGPAGLALVADAVPVPVVGIGGITPQRALELADTGAAGVAVVGAVMSALDPAHATRHLLRAFAPAGDP
jgi:thiamine-phosphate pyrophosphorylase